MKTNQDYDYIKGIPIYNIDLLREIQRKLIETFQGKREIMYSDIINLIIRERKVGENYNNLIIWCNYKIRSGETFLEI